MPLNEVEVYLLKAELNAALIQVIFFVLIFPHLLFKIKHLYKRTVICHCSIVKYFKEIGAVSLPHFIEIRHIKIYHGSYTQNI